MVRSRLGPNRSGTELPQHYHKVCVIVKAFAQKPGIDYTDTYAPVAHLESTRTILHIGASLNWEIHQMDIKTAFLHGDLEEEVYMEQSEGMLRIQKGILGLLHAKDSLWTDAGCMSLESTSPSCHADIGYVRTTADHCIYMHKTLEGSSILTIHVDDICAAASRTTEMVKLKAQLRQFFNLVDLSELKWLLGIAITRNRPVHTTIYPFAKVHISRV